MTVIEDEGIEMCAFCPFLDVKFDHDKIWWLISTYAFRMQNKGSVLGDISRKFVSFTMDRFC